MGFVYTEIKLTNAGDIAMAQRCALGADDVRHMTITVLVDSGAWQLAINENIQEYLQLPFVRKQGAQTADGRRWDYDLVGPVRIDWQNRTCLVEALVLPEDSEPLLGAIPMESMDLAILPLEGKLVGRHHPDYAIFRI